MRMLLFTLRVTKVNTVRYTTSILRKGHGILCGHTVTLAESGFNLDLK